MSCSLNKPAEPENVAITILRLTKELTSSGYEKKFEKLEKALRDNLYKLWDPENEQYVRSFPVYNALFNCFSLIVSLDINKQKYRQSIFKSENIYYANIGQNIEKASRLYGFNSYMCEFIQRSIQLSVFANMAPFVLPLIFEELDSMQLYNREMNRKDILKMFNKSLGSNYFSLFLFEYANYCISRDDILLKWFKQLEFQTNHIIIMIGNMIIKYNLQFLLKTMTRLLYLCSQAFTTAVIEMICGRIFQEWQRVDQSITTKIETKVNSAAAALSCLKINQHILCSNSKMLQEMLIITCKVMEDHLLKSNHRLMRIAFLISHYLSKLQKLEANNDSTSDNPPLNISSFYTGTSNDDEFRFFCDYMEDPYKSLVYDSAPDPLENGTNTDPEQKKEFVKNAYLTSNTAGMIVNKSNSSSQVKTSSSRNSSESKVWHLNDICKALSQMNVFEQKQQQNKSQKLLLETIDKICQVVCIANQDYLDTTVQYVEIFERLLSFDMSWYDLSVGIAAQHQIENNLFSQFTSQIANKLNISVTQYKLHFVACVCLAKAYEEIWEKYKYQIAIPSNSSIMLQFVYIVNIYFETVFELLKIKHEQAHFRKIILDMRLELFEHIIWQILQLLLLQVHRFWKKNERDFKYERDNLRNIAHELVFALLISVKVLIATKIPITKYFADFLGICLLFLQLDLAAHSKMTNLIFLDIVLEQGFNYSQALSMDNQVQEYLAVLKKFFLEAATEPDPAISNIIHRIGVKLLKL